MSKLNLLDLFSGIGGFSLGLERTGGFETVAFSEIEDFPSKILNKHWPEVPNYGDIRDLTASRLRDDGISVDAICGGFPCQDISTAGKGAGIEGERSGLWSEYARLIGELRPAVVFVENVAALLSRGLDRVLGDLAALGYDAEWHCIPASAIGAHHHRDRLWIVANSEHVERSKPLQNGCRQSLEGRATPERGQGTSKVAGCGSVLADPNGVDAQGLIGRVISSQVRSLPGERQTGPQYPRIGGAWEPEPNVGRVADGVSHRSHRLKALGNAVVPQIPELIGNAYLESIGWRAAA